MGNYIILLFVKVNLCPPPEPRMSEMYPFRFTLLFTSRLVWAPVMVPGNRMIS
jgi:hypothetical protein